MDKRYQVFISSTYTDLKEERKSIIETLLNAKFIPAGMEMFSASNDEQFKYIKKIIDTCDYYILIVGARYGSVNSTTGVSFTEQEYDYAISKNIPVLTFLHGDPYNLPTEKRDDNQRELLEAFRAKVSRSRLCRIWNSINELVPSVLSSLIEQTAENPQLGWTRGSTYDATELLSQINNLRLDKEKLQEEIINLKQIIKGNSAKVGNLESGSDIYNITGKIFWNSRYTIHHMKLSWDKIFAAIGPYLMSYKRYELFKSDLKSAINSAYNQSFNSLNEDCVQTIKIQFVALGFIDVNISTGTEFVGLTQKGREYLLQIKSVTK